MNALSLPPDPLSQRVSRRDALITGVLLASGALWNNGCATNANDKLRIWSMWPGDEGKFFIDTLREFEKAHPGVQCENLGAVDDQKSVRAIVAGAPPDLLTLNLFRYPRVKRCPEAPDSFSRCRIIEHLLALRNLVAFTAFHINNNVFRAMALTQVFNHNCSMDVKKLPFVHDYQETQCTKIRQINWTVHEVSSDLI
jgi:hypothetical protein